MGEKKDDNLIQGVNATQSLWRLGLTTVSVVSQAVPLTGVKLHRDFVFLQQFCALELS